MAEDRASDGVVLGLDTAAGAVGPALQLGQGGAAGALIDSTHTGERVTELRIHGVSGSDGPTMLEHPTALQVAGDTITGFYRRWNPGGGGRPSAGWNLEAIRGRADRAATSVGIVGAASTFMMYNLAHFMLPESPPRDRKGNRSEAGRAGWDRGHQIAHALLRLLALAATDQFITAIATLTVSTVAWQAAGHSGALPNG